MIKKKGGGYHLEQTNVERLIFRNFEIVMLKGQKMSYSIFLINFFV